MGATLTTVDNILKEVYEEQLRDQLQSEQIAIKRIEKSSEGVEHKVGGKYVRFPIRIKRNHGIGSRNELEALPAAGQQAYEDAQVKLTYMYGTIQLTGQALELAEKNYQAFASAMQLEMDGIKQGLAKDTNRQAYGTSKGVLSTATGAGTTTTFVTTVANAIYLEIGMIVDLYSSADALKESAREITNVSRNLSTGAATVTFTPAAGANTASGDYLVRDDNKDKEVSGFASITDSSSTLYTIDPSTTPVWAGVVDDPGSARNLSEGIMVNIVDQVRTNGGRTTVIFTSLGVRRAYFNLLVQQRRFTNTQSFEGGFSGLAFTTDWGDIPVVSDFDCPFNTAYFLNEKEITVYEAGDWSFMDRDGSKWQRVIGASGSTINYFDAYTATMFKYWNLGTHRRNSQAVMKNINEA
jgi:hypothetical protein